MVRYDFTFDDFGNVSCSCQKCKDRPAPSPKMDMRADPKPKAECEIVDEGCGNATVFAPDGMSLVEAEYSLAEHYNARVRGLMAHMAMLGENGGV